MKNIFFMILIEKDVFFIYYLLFYQFIWYCIINIIKDFKIQKNYGNVGCDKNTNSISLIDEDLLKQYEIGHIFTKEKDFYYFSRKNRIFNVKNNLDYSFIDILTDINGKIWGKDNQGNNLYFPEDVESPVNDIFIDNNYNYNKGCGNIQIGKIVFYIILIKILKGK